MILVTRMDYFILHDNDLLTIILSDTNITSGYDYKVCTLVCRAWKNAIASPERAHMYMNVVSTLVMHHPELKWSGSICGRITMDALSLIKDPNWYYISKNRRLTPVFIRENWLKFDLGNLTINRALTLDILEEHWDELHKEHRWLNSNMTYDFIKARIQDVEWKYISCNRGLEARFIDQYKNYFNWDDLSRNRALTLELIYKCIHLIDWDCIWNNPNITMRFIEDHIDKLNAKFYSLSQCKNLSVEFVEKNINKFEIYIERQKCLTSAFIRANIAKLKMSQLSPNRAFTLELIEENIDHIVWGSIYYNPNVTIAFMEKHIARFDGLLYGNARFGCGTCG